MATDAIAKNHVRIGDQRIKPSRLVLVGDKITIEKVPYQFHVTVLALQDQRRPASEAQLLYEESEHSINARQQLRERLRNDVIARAGVAGAGKPSKKQRRQIIRFQNQNELKDKPSDDQ